ncbi:MAG: hypothetical protein AAFX92_19995 [Pseudomonadota bacterium]
MTSTAQCLGVGDLTLLYEPGLIRRVTFGGVEVLRMINAPLRDANWATLPASIVDSSVDDDRDRLRIKERFTVADGALEGLLEFEAEASGRLTASLSLTAKDDVATNRAGFTLLHPIAGVAGADLTVRHSDSSQEVTQFPDRIAPAQPAFDIVGLSYSLRGILVDIAFEGEIFEMEDQRNWSDASFKTYCRPLALPTPYTIAAGETVTQRIAVTLNAKAGTTGHRGDRPAAKSVSLPTIGLACEPDWLGPLPARLTPVLRFYGPDGWTDAHLRTFASGSDVDVEIVVPDGADAKTVLSSIKGRLDAATLHAAHVIALPEAYLKSYQPSGPWPSGLSPAGCARAARQAFPDARIGVGMLTHFTEFNRHPPDLSLGDYVTFGNSAIVHAADDLSVWETLETLPDIFASARALSGDLPIRLGLISIGMRTNPYGAGLVVNPNGERLAMTGDDPRQAETFAAAYAVAAMALAAEAGVEAITLAAPAGRFGLAGKDGPRPIAKAVRALTALGDRIQVERTHDSVSLSSAAGRITAHTEGAGKLEIDGLEDADGR